MEQDFDIDAFLAEMFPSPATGPPLAFDPAVDRVARTFVPNATTTTTREQAFPAAISTAGVGLGASTSTGVGAGRVPLSQTLPLTPGTRSLLLGTAPSVSTTGVGLGTAGAPSAQPRRRRRVATRRAPFTGARGRATTTTNRRVARVRNTPATRRNVRSLQQQADAAVRRRRMAAVTETRTITTTYKGANQRPSVIRTSTRQTQ